MHAPGQRCHRALACLRNLATVATTERGVREAGDAIMSRTCYVYRVRELVCTALDRDGKEARIQDDPRSEFSARQADARPRFAPQQQQPLPRSKPQSQHFHTLYIMANSTMRYLHSCSQSSRAGSTWTASPSPMAVPCTEAT